MHVHEAVCVVWNIQVNVIATQRFCLVDSAYGMCGVVGRATGSNEDKPGKQAQQPQT